MSSDLAVFDFQKQAVRVMDGDGSPWFCAVDVCRVLGIKNPPQAIQALDDDEKRKVALEGGPRVGTAHQNSYVSESGLYAIIFRSKKPSARAFRKWVTSVVLPAVRKTGRFEVEAEKSAPEIVYLRIDQVHGFRHLYFDEQAAIARFVRKEADIQGIEVTKVHANGVGMVRVYPADFLNETFERWKSGVGIPLKYRRRHKMIEASARSFMLMARS